jgi:antimicrobial peptide system SdpA family protein
MQPKRFMLRKLHTPAALGVLALVQLCLLGAFAITAALAAMPFNTLNVPNEVNRTIMSLIPEGWGFFTKSPRDPETHIARLQNGVLQELNIVSSFQAKYVFGFNRLARAQGLEVDELLLQLQASSLWRNCQQSITVCSQNLAVQKKLVNAVHAPTLCGDLLLFERRPIPWAYRESKPVMPSRLTRVEVVCSHV